MKNTRFVLKLRAGIIQCLLLALVVLPLRTQAQNAEPRLDSLRSMLDNLSAQIPGLRNKSDLSLTNVPLHDYLRSLGKVHHVNLYVDDMPNAIVTNDFVDEPLITIFLFVCKKFNLTIEPTGTILHFVPYVPAPVKAEVAPPKKVGITWANNRVSFDLKNDTLSTVLKELSRLSGQMIITDPGTENGLLSGYIPAAELETALQNLLYMNGYALNPHRKGFFIVSKTGSTPLTNPPKGAPPKNPMAGNNATPGGGPTEYSLEVAFDTAGLPLIFLRAENMSIDRVTRDLFSQIGVEYYLFDQLEGNTTLNIEGGATEDVLKNLLRGTDYTWKVDQGVFLLGKRDMEGLRTVKILNLKYRPTDKVLDLIPTQLKEGVEVKEFVELNRIILSGSSEQIREIELFVMEIDRPVPMVKIEMMVVDVDFSRLMKTGVKAGLLQPGDSVGAVKSIFPGLNYNLTGGEINGILAGSGIPALANLGALKSNFYLQLQAEESRGNLRVVTRPVISTLNGNEASITIGQTDYYLLESQIYNAGAVNNFNTISQRYERIEINTTITVKPLVSNDGMVTLELAPNFTAPGKQLSTQVPPSILTRKFESIIRVKEGETVVLGGLSRESTSNTSDGLPFISRVPVLRNLFGSVSRGKSRSSLIIYITPTIYYN